MLKAFSKNETNYSNDNHAANCSFLMEMEDADDESHDLIKHFLVQHILYFVNKYLHISEELVLEIFQFILIHLIEERIVF